MVVATALWFECIWTSIGIIFDSAFPPSSAWFSFIYSAKQEMKWYGMMATATVPVPLRLLYGCGTLIRKIQFQLALVALQTTELVAEPKQSNKAIKRKVVCERGRESSRQNANGMRQDNKHYKSWRWWRSVIIVCTYMHLRPKDVSSGCDGAIRGRLERENSQTKESVGTCLKSESNVSMKWSSHKWLQATTTI